MNPTACAGCATPLPAAADACPGCSAPVGRQLRTWVSPSAWVTAVEWVDGIRVVKMLKDLDDQGNCARLRREAEALAALSGRVPPGSVPEVLASGRGVVVTRFVPGVSVQRVLSRRNVDRALPVMAAGRAVAALHAADLLGPRSRSEPGGLIPHLEAVEDLFPAWLLEAAVSAGNERVAHPVVGVGSRRSSSSRRGRRPASDGWRTGWSSSPGTTGSASRPLAEDFASCGRPPCGSGCGKSWGSWRSGVATDGQGRARRK